MKLIPNPYTALNDDLPDYHCNGDDFGYEPLTASCYEALEIMPMGKERHSFGHGKGLDMVELPWRISSRGYSFEDPPFLLSHSVTGAL